MKRIVNFMLASVTVLAVASCQKEMANEPEGSFEVFTVTASIGTDTKTVLEDTAEGNKIYWTPGDQISLFNTSGAEVVFSTDITEKSVSATFENQDAFEAPDNLIAVYPTRTDKTTTYDAVTNVINTLHIGGTQTAVAGSFDPQFAVAVGTETGEGKLSFKNVHSLIKFTIGGDTAPTTVTLKNNGSGMIAGNFNYDLTNNIATATAGESTINLTGTFEVGRTYYIAMEPVECINGISLLFDGVTVKNTGVTKTFDPNKIYNLGTVEMPEVQINATLVKSFQSHGETSYMTAFGGAGGNDRNIAIDGDYLYIPETKETPVMWQVSLTDGTANKMPVGTVATGGTFALSCPRFLKNEDAEVNGGKDILVVSSMGMNGEETYLYFYKNGLNADPHKVALHNGGNINRRLGDKMTIFGTMQSWAAYYKEQGSSAIINWAGTANVLNVDDIWPAGRTHMDPTDDSNMGAIYFYSKETAGVKGVITTVSNGKYGVIDGVTKYETKDVYVAQEWGTDPSLAGCHGFNFFKIGGKDFIAYTKFSDKTVYVIKGAANADGVKAALEANEIVWSSKIAADDNSCNSSHSGADCSIHVIDSNNVLVAGHIQNVGVVVYKLSAN